MTEQEKPNADIIGKKVTIAGREWTIADTPAWSGQYVLLVGADPQSTPGIIDALCRPAAVIRQHIRLNGTVE